MKKIVWLIQQTYHSGGTEMVSINLLKELKKLNYDCLLISVAARQNESFFDSSDLEVASLGLPIEVCCFDRYLKEYLNKCQYFKVIGLSLRLFYHFVVKKNYYRKKIQAITCEDDIIIASSLDSYLFAPSKREVIFHYHFDANDYLHPFFKFMLRLCIKPKHTVFLTDSARDNIVKAKPELKNKSSVIHNPSRFKREKIPSHDKLNLIYVGRLETQKNPELLIEVCKVLKEKAFNYHLYICGDGSKYAKVKKMIEDYSLVDEISMLGSIKNIEAYYRLCDGQIVTSFTEGYALSIIEANCFSIYTISTHCGDAIYEVIEEGVNGKVVDSFDPLEIADCIIDSFSGDYEKLKISAYNHAENYEINKIIKKWDELFKSL